MAEHERRRSFGKGVWANIPTTSAMDYDAVVKMVEGLTAENERLSLENNELRAKLMAAGFNSDWVSVEEIKEAHQYFWELYSGKMAKIEQLTAENERLKDLLRPFAQAVQDCQAAGGAILNVKRFVTNRMIYNAARGLEGGNDGT